MNKIPTFALVVFGLFFLTPASTNAQKVQDSLNKTPTEKKKPKKFKSEYRAEIFGFWQPEAKEFDHSSETTSLGYNFSFGLQPRKTPFVFVAYQEVSTKKILEKKWEQPGPIQNLEKNEIEASTGISIKVPIKFSRKHGLCFQITKDIITVSDSEFNLNTAWPRVYSFFDFEIIEDFVEIGLGTLYQFKVTNTVTPIFRIEFNLNNHK